MTERWGLQFHYDLNGVGVTSKEAIAVVDAVRGSNLELGDYTYVSAGEDVLSLTISFQVAGLDILQVLRDATKVTAVAVQLSSIPVIGLSSVITTHLNEGGAPDDAISH